MAERGHISQSQTQTGANVPQTKAVTVLDGTRTDALRTLLKKEQMQTGLLV